jgi:hypothetical protein
MSSKGHGSHGMAHAGFRIFCGALKKEGNDSINVEKEETNIRKEFSLHKGHNGESLSLDYQQQKHRVR